MKKTFLTLGLLSSLAFAANAQDAAATTSSSELKAGNVTVELNAASPFSGGGSDPFSLINNALRFRYFLNEGTAIRLGFSIDRSGYNNTYGTKTEVSNNIAGTSTSGSEEQNKISVKSSEFQFSIMPGIEFHKMVSERLSAYYGGYLEFTSNSKKSSLEVTSGSESAAGVSTSNFSGSYKEEWKGASLQEIDADAAAFTAALNGTGRLGTVSAGQERNTPGFTRIGLIGVLGADYYITKGLYLGVELGWGLTTTSYKAVEYTRSNSTISSTPATPANSQEVKETDLGKNKSGLQLAPFANGQFRFGFRF